jgi:hypothetical protein
MAASAAAGPATISPGGGGLATSPAAEVLGWPGGLKVMCWNVGLHDKAVPEDSGGPDQNGNDEPLRVYAAPDFVREARHHILSGLMRIVALSTVFTGTHGHDRSCSCSLVFLAMPLLRSTYPLIKRAAGLRKHMYDELRKCTCMTSSESAHSGLIRPARLTHDGQSLLLLHRRSSTGDPA